MKIKVGDVVKLTRPWTFTNVYGDEVPYADTGALYWVRNIEYTSEGEPFGWLLTRSRGYGQWYGIDKFISTDDPEVKDSGLEVLGDLMFLDLPDSFIENLDYELQKIYYLYKWVKDLCRTSHDHMIYGSK